MTTAAEETPAREAEGGSGDELTSPDAATVTGTGDDEAAESAQDGAGAGDDAEAVHDDGAAGDAAAAPPRPTPVSTLTPEQIEETFKKLAASAKTWRRRVEELLGEDASFLVPCELCDPDLPGFHWPIDSAQPANDLQAALFEVLGSPQAPDYLPAPDVKTCETCNGYGKVGTGSKVPDKKTKTCPTCRGFGFDPPPEVGPLSALAQGAGVTPAASEAAPLVEELVDGWGSPKYLPDGQENPNYGRMPQYKHPDLP